MALSHHLACSSPKEERGGDRIDGIQLEQR